MATHRPNGDPIPFSERAAEFLKRLDALCEEYDIGLESYAQAVGITRTSADGMQVVNEVSE